MKKFSLLFVLALSLTAFASQDSVESLEAVESVEVKQQVEALEWGCTAIDGNYHPYWGRTASEALNNCYSRSQTGDCRISSCD